MYRRLLAKIVPYAYTMFDNDGGTFSATDDDDDFPAPSEFNIAKLHSTLRQVMRDWSSEGTEKYAAVLLDLFLLYDLIGASERDQCYSPILREIERLYSHVPSNERHKLRICVPGKLILNLFMQQTSENGTS